MEGLELIRDLGSVVLAAAIAGWICQRLGLSVVVGYLAAGVIAGPHIPWPVLVGDYDRITTLSQIGLVFLMFSMGLELSVTRMRSLGISVIVAVATTAVLVLLSARLLGAFAGLGVVQGMFLAGVMMVSSSAIIGKSLIEARRAHERSGQTVLAMTLLEDVVAASMIAILTSYVAIGGGEAGVGRAVALLAAFVTVLLLGGLLVVPTLLRWYGGGTLRELQTLIVAGLLFTLAYLAQYVGYSLALGSFILGAVVAETRQRGQVERSFAGLRDLFSAVFFVAIGMMIEVELLVELWWLVLALVVIVIVLRAASAAIGAVISGRPLEEAVEAGLSLTPIGEFSFVIAGIAVAAGVFDAGFQAVVVATGIVTALVAPMLTRHAPVIAAALVRRTSSRFRGVVAGYRSWLDRAAELRAGNVVWQLSKKRMLQVLLGVLFATGWLVFVPVFEEPVAVWMNMNAGSPAYRIFYWCATVVVGSVPLVAVWRNISAMALLYSEVASAGFRNRPAVQNVIGHAIKAICAAGLVLWFGSLIPFEASQRWLIAGGIALSLVLLWLFWRSLVRWNSELEVRIGETLGPGATGKGSSQRIAAAAHVRGWAWTVEECAIPENAAIAGRTIAELGLRTRHLCSVVGIDRQGFSINNPGGSERIYPLDVLLLAGTPEAIRRARIELEAVAETAEAAICEFAVERYKVIPGGPRTGVSLFDAQVGQKTGAQIVAIRRGGTEIASPGGGEVLKAGDDLLVVGSRTQLDAFRQWLGGAN